MKKKLLIGGGLVALVAVIVAIAVFGKGGDYFKGALGIITLDKEISDVKNIEEIGYVIPSLTEDAVSNTVSEGPNFYVASNYGCDNTRILGSKGCPFAEIQEAISRYFEVVGSTNESTIYVAEGTYEPFNASNAKIKLKGGYNNDFTSTGLLSKVKSGSSFSGITGVISGFWFEAQAGSTSLLNIANTSQPIEIYNNTFSGLTSGNTVNVSGANTMLFKNNFSSITADKSVVYASGSAVVSENNFFQSVAKDAAGGIINVNGAFAYNNLISHSLAGTSNAIYASGTASLVANNTISDNILSKSALLLGGTAKAYNNLIVANNVGSPIVFEGDSATADKNGIENSSFGAMTTTLRNSNIECSSKFASTRTYDANNYKLGADSTCVDQGLVVQKAAKDYFGTSRPQGVKYDIGFHELSATLIPIKPLIPETLTMATCGNNKVEVGETCDDGNKTNGDGCSSTCLIEIAPRPTDFCGNGIVNPLTEECDDGNKTSGDGCSSTCKIEEDEDEDEDENDNLPTIPEEETQCGEWSDVSESDPEYDIWMYLCEKGIVKGNDDGTLRAEDKLNRAEVFALATRAGEYKDTFNLDSNAKNCFPDVKEQWYAKYFCSGKNQGFIQGYDDGYAKPERNVILAEALKIYLGVFDEPFDVSDRDCWYCEMVEESGDDKYLPYSFTDPKQVGPIELTRRKAFNMLYRIMIYR